MTIIRMEHFTILATDTKQSIAFYEDILGLTTGLRPTSRHAANAGAIFFLVEDDRAVLRGGSRHT